MKQKAIRFFIQSAVATVLLTGVAACSAGHQLVPVQKGKAVANPGAGLELIRRGNLLLGEKKYSAALQKGQEALGKIPEKNTNLRADAYFLTGSAYYGLEEKGKAEAAWKQVVKIRPKMEKAWLQLAILHGVGGKAKESIQDFENLVAIRPGESLYKLKLATWLKRDRQFGKAEKILLELENSGFEKKELARNLLAEIKSEQGDYEAASLWYQKINGGSKNQRLNRGSREARLNIWLVKGRKALVNQKYAQARQAFDKGLAIDKERPDLWFYRGEALAGLKKYAAAEKSFLKGLQLTQNKSSLGMAYIIGFYTQQNWQEKALAWVKKAREKEIRNPSLALALARFFERYNQAARALEYYHQAVDLSPEDPQVLLSLALLYGQRERFQEGLKYLVRLKSIYTKANNLKELKSVENLIKRFRARHLDTLARKRRAKGNFEAAEKLYKKAFEIMPGWEVLYLGQGQMEEQRGNTDQAIIHYNQALEKDPQFEAALYGLLNIYEKKGVAYTSEIEEIKIKLGGLSDNEADALYNEALQLILKNDYEKAGQKLRACLDVNNNHNGCRSQLSKILNQRGTKLAGDGKFEKAEEVLSEAASLAPADEEIAGNLKTVQENKQYQGLYQKMETAAYYLNKEQYAKALPVYEELYNTLPRPGFLINLINCHFGLGQEPEAFELLAKGQKKFGQDPRFLESVYSYYMTKGEEEKARTGFQELIRNYPDRAFAYFKLGVFALREEKADQARKRFTEAIIHEPTLGEAYIGRGINSFNQDRTQEARFDFRKAAEFEGSRILALENLGMSHLLRQNTQRAREIFQSLQKSYPKDSTGYYYLGLMEYLDNKLDKSLEYFRQANELEPLYRNLSAISKVLRRRQKEDGLSATEKKELVTVYRELLKMPAREYKPSQLRQWIAQLGENKAVVHSLIPAAPAKFSPLRRGDLVYHLAEREIVAYDMTSWKRVWSRVFFQPMKGVASKSHLVVLSGNKLYWLDWQRGKVFKTIKLFYQAEALGPLAGSHVYYFRPPDNKGRYQLIQKSLLSFSEKNMGFFASQSPPVAWVSQNQEKTGPGLVVVAAEPAKKVGKITWRAFQLNVQKGLSQKKPFWLSEGAGQDRVLAPFFVGLAGTQAVVWNLETQEKLGTEKQGKNFRGIFQDKNRLVLVWSNRVVEYQADGDRTEHSGKEMGYGLRGFFRAGQNGESQPSFVDYQYKIRNPTWMKLLKNKPVELPAKPAGKALENRTWYFSVFPPVAAGS